MSDRAVDTFRDKTRLDQQCIEEIKRDDSEYPLCVKHDERVTVGTLCDEIIRLREKIAAMWPLYSKAVQNDQIPSHYELQTGTYRERNYVEAEAD